jgi:hypothetical protein
MEYESEFFETGKKMPYSVPDGFFEGITGKTLAEARHREKIRRKKIIMWRSYSVAASLAAFLAIGYFLLFPPSEKYTGQTARNNTETISEDIFGADPSILQDTNPQISVKDQENIENLTINRSDEPENIGDVLSALSNDELLQLATLYRTDIFLDENENNLQ